MVQVRPFPRDDVRMHMRHTLPRLRPVLHSDIQTRRAVHALNHPSDPLHGKEEIARFGGGQVRNAGNAPARGNEDVAREDGFEVYKGEGERCEVEDLADCQTDDLLVKGWEGPLPGR